MGREDSLNLRVRGTFLVVGDNWARSFRLASRILDSTPRTWLRTSAPRRKISNRIQRPTHVLTHVLPAV